MTKITQTMTDTQEQEHHTEQQRRASRKLHPLLMDWLAAHAELFTSAKGDLVKAPEKHPHVLAIQAKLSSVPFQTAVKMAWLVWRATQVQFWTRDSTRDTYAVVQGLTVLVHRGTNTCDWAHALISAEERDGRHDAAFQKRAEYYARMQKEQEAEEAFALSLMKLSSGTARTGADVDLTPSTHNSAASKAALVAQAKEQRKAK